MPKDPKDQKHSDEVDLSAIQAGPITKDGGEDKPADAPHGDKNVEANVAATAKSEPSARRKEIDKAASSPRWEG